MSRDTSVAAAITDDDFAEAFEVAHLAADRSPLLLAVSGGPDSIALMGATAAWCRVAGGPPLAVATVDHGLRPGSRAEAEAVGRAAASLDLGHAILTWTRRPGGPTSQTSARDARYRLLVAHARAVGARRIATAHTRDDQAETILMRLADGSGLTGLAGMAGESRRGDLLHLRPFLGFDKAALVATCRARGWPYVEDPSNADPRFARTRWRALMPALAAEDLDARRLARFAGRMRRADIALEAGAVAVAERLVRRHPDTAIVIDFDALVAEPDEIALRVFLHALADSGPHGEGPRIRLDRAEAGLAALRAARIVGTATRRTLAGRLLSLGRDGRLAIQIEPPRRRGRDGVAATASPQGRRIHLA